jgi:protein-tyrosine phosphatase
LLHSLGIDTICDLRANDERSERPTVWHDGTATELWARDHLFSVGGLHGLAAKADVGPEDTRASMFEIYRALPFEQAVSYRELFNRLAAGRVPVVFNCSAGKDRTGVAGALILSVLGVPRSTIDEDYLLSNDMLDGLIAYMKTSAAYGPLVEHRQEVAMPMLRVERDYLDESFAVIEREHGTVERYLDEVLGIDADGQAAMREHLLD